MPPQYFNDDEIERRARLLARQIADDERTERMAETPREGERLAVLEVQMKHLHEQLKTSQETISRIDEKLGSIENIITRASGAKLALMIIGGGIAFALSQAWSVLGYFKAH